MGPIIADNYFAGGRDMIVYHYSVVEALRRHDGKAASAAIVDDIVLGGKAVARMVEENDGVA
jgi:DNA-binding GntR family transcriptional regulator